MLFGTKGLEAVFKVQLFAAEVQLRRVFSKQTMLAVQHIMTRMAHLLLKDRMKLKFRLKKKKGFGIEFHEFVQERGKEAQALHLHGVAKRYQFCGRDENTNSGNEVL